MRISQQGEPTSSTSWLDEFSAYLVAQDLRPRTISGYLQDLRAFRKWLVNVRDGEPPLSEITTVDLISYRAHLTDGERRKPTTINRHLQSIQRLFRWAHTCGRIPTNPALEIRSVRLSPRNRPMGLEGGEVHAMLRAAGMSVYGKADRNYALVQLMLQTGMRVSEVAALRGGDLTLSKRYGVIRVRDGKGRRFRDVPLNATARRALRRYLGSRLPLDSDEPVFDNGRGGAMSRRAIQNAIRTIGERAKITRMTVSPHTLRHTFAIGYLRGNPGKLVELRDLLGHDSIDTTAIYTKPSAKELAQDVERSPYNVY